MVSALVAFVIIFFLNREKTAEEVEEVYDTQLAQTSRILQSFLTRPKEEINFAHITQALAAAERTYNSTNATDEGHPYELKFGIQIWDNDKKLLTKSPGMIDTPLSTFKDGYFVMDMQNYSWNVFTHYMDSSGYWVMIAERGDVREEMIEDIIITSFLGPVIGIVILICLIFFVIYQGLKPLTLMSDQLYERHVNKLTPLDSASAPKELIPLATAINTLMNKVENQIERERQFLGDIAHELRTPLSTIKLQAQAALKSDDLSSAHQALAKIVRGVDGSTHLISQLLTLARLDIKALGEPVVIDFSLIIEKLLKTYHGVERKILVDANEWPSDIQGYPLLIEVVIRNLLENAIKHTPAGKRIFILLNNQRDDLTLSITDEGQGVSEEKIASLGQRFFREKSADQSGSGLGLSIVYRIVILHNATLQFAHNKPSGLIATVVFNKKTAS
jgi:two-component system sensor histidine kinase QseC